MNSFATNALSSHNMLCSREAIEQAVNVMHKALLESSLETDKTLVARGEWISRDKTLRFHVISEGEWSTDRTTAAEVQS